jgi:hypothetical protein
MGRLAQSSCIWGGLSDGAWDHECQCQWGTAVRLRSNQVSFLAVRFGIWNRPNRLNAADEIESGQFQELAAARLGSSKPTKPEEGDISV